MAFKKKKALIPRQWDPSDTFIKDFFTAALYANEMS